MISIEFIVTLALIFTSAFAKVFIAAFQQKNVIQDLYWWILPTSYLRAVAEFVSIGLVAVVFIQAESALTSFFAMSTLGIGGGLGCLLSMMIHNKVFQRRQRSRDYGITHFAERRRRQQDEKTTVAKPQSIKD